MNNPLTKTPLTRIAYTLTLCPNQERRRLRTLRTMHASAVKQLAFVNAQLARGLKALLNP